MSAIKQNYKKISQKQQETETEDYSKINFLITAIYVTVISSIVLCNLLLADTADFHCKIAFSHSNLSYLLYGMAIIVIYIFIAKNLKKFYLNLHFFQKINFFQFQMNKLVFVLSIMWIFIQFYLIFNYYFRTGWDSDFILSTTEVIARGDPPDMEQNFYFSLYPNNLFLLYIFSVIRKIDLAVGIFDVKEGIMCLVFIQCIIFSITAYLLYKTIYWFKKSNSLAWTGWIFYIIFIGLSPWISIPYSDATGLLFPILILYLYLEYLNSDRKSKYFFLISVVGYLGFKIKPQALIMFIAVIISEVISLLKNIRRKNLQLSTISKKVIYIFLALILTSGAVKTTVDSMGFKLSDNMEFGWQHFLMMGLNPDRGGVWSGEDVEFSGSFSTRQERNSQNLEEACRRIQNYGVAGLAKHLLKKTLTIVSDGTFAWGVEGTFYIEYYESRNNIVSPILKSIYYSDGSLHHYWKDLAQMCWMVCLVGMIGACFYKKNIQKNSSLYTMMTGIMGLIVFELLFEARSRYLFTFIPIFIILSVIGWAEIIQNISVAIQKYL